MQTLTREQKELRWQIINFWRFHNPDTGFKEFKPGTPQFVRDLLEEITETNLTAARTASNKAALRHNTKEKTCLTNQDA